MDVNMDLNQLSVLGVQRSMIKYGNLGSIIKQFSDVPIKQFSTQFSKNNNSI